MGWREMEVIVAGVFVGLGRDGGSVGMSVKYEWGYC